MDATLQLLLSTITSFIASIWAFPCFLRISKDKGLVDNPNPRKLQDRPVPVIGGLVVFFGMLCGGLMFVALQMNRPFEMSQSLDPLLLGAGITLYVGVLDDLSGLKAWQRIVVEVLVMLGLIYGSGMCVDSLHGLLGVEDFSWWVGVPLTVFAGVGIINAYNMVDGVNGLSSGLCILCSIMLGIISYRRVDYANSSLAFCYAASLVVFFVHNVFGKHSKMFIGDGGTMVMGLMVSWFTICVLSTENNESIGRLALTGRELGLVPMMLSVASVPVFDTLRVMTARIMRGDSPFKADKRHLHHIFIAVGLSHAVTCFSELIITVVIVLLWYLSFNLGWSVNAQFAVVLVSAVVLVWGMYFYLNRIVQYDKDSWIRRISDKTHFGTKKWWIRIQNWVDRERPW